MNYENKHHQSVLIVDDSEINRCILRDILCDKFTVYEAQNGAEAMALVEQHQNDLSVVLLDILMPVMDGFEVLVAMNKLGHIEHIPVIMISAESSDSYVEKAYELGATDFINKPFEPNIVRRRIINTITLYNKQQSLMEIVVDQVYEQQKVSSMMIGILSHIVETQNGESGLHTVHINTMTRILLNCLLRKTDKYPLTQKDVDIISIASSLHDIGKMQVPDAILNKPGRFTDEEFAVMKKHTIWGAETLKQLDDCTDEPLMKYSYEICRWHHERYDGRGYPDGLKGDEIPIWAQVVSIADVYDALTADRVYKKAFDADTAIKMIFNGECGSFNPLLLECLVESQETIKKELSSTVQAHYEVVREIANEVLQQDPVGLSQKTFNMYHWEKIKNDFYNNLSDGVHFEYSFANRELLMRENTHLGKKEQVYKNPMQNKAILSYAGEEPLLRCVSLARQATPTKPQFESSFEANLKDGTVVKYNVHCLVIFEENSSTRSGIIGKIVETR